MTHKASNILRKLGTANALRRSYGMKWVVHFAISKLPQYKPQSRFLNKTKRMVTSFDIAQVRNLPPINTRDKSIPFFSIVVPTFNTNSDLLIQMVGSVYNQTYKNWELVIQDDCSTTPETIDQLQKFIGLSWRIRVLRNPTNLGISETSNQAVLRTTGDWLLFLDHDDLLHPSALELFAWEIRHNDCEYLYSDEDKITVSGVHFDLTNKPSWSPETLLDHMYALHPIVIKKKVFLDIGMFRKEFSGAQDYDLALRLALAKAKVKHIPKNLYHWRASEGSSALNGSEKNWALPLAKKSLEEHVKNFYSETAFVMSGYFENHFRVRFARLDWPKVTVLIPTDSRTNPAEGNLFLDSLCRSLNLDSYPGDVEVLVVDNCNLPTTFKSSFVDQRIKFINYSYEGNFNFAKKINYSAKHATGEILILLNDDMKIVTNDWISCLVEWATLPEIGCVGSKLVYPNGRVQHAGVSFSSDTGTRHLFYNSTYPFPPGEFWVNVFRNSEIVTGAGMAVKTTIYRELGGFDENLSIDFNDTDFCLRVARSGLRNVYNPYSVIQHYEGATISRQTPKVSELEYFRDRWSNVNPDLLINSTYWR
jgi:GT2 family glycosyltransferase